MTITKPFYLGVYEVTTTEFKQVTGQEAGLRFDGVDDDKQFPVTWVPMEQVAEFLKTLSKKEKQTYRLPTEAEWEFACRAGTHTAFWTGATIDGDQLNCHAVDAYGDGKPGEYLKRPVNVGSFRPNPFGLNDVHGNVAELCSDWYDRNYYANSPERDPAGPKKPKENPEHADHELVAIGARHPGGDSLPAAGRAGRRPNLGAATAAHRHRARLGTAARLAQAAAVVPSAFFATENTGQVKLTLV